MSNLFVRSGGVLVPVGGGGGGGGIISGPWTDMVFDNGWSGVSGQIPQYRTNGDRVELRGTLNKAGSTSVQFWTIPAGLWPFIHESFGVLASGSELATLTFTELGSANAFPPSSPSGDST